jgi:hypothetical protein
MTVCALGSPARVGSPWQHKNKLAVLSSGAVVHHSVVVELKGLVNASILIRHCSVVRAVLLSPLLRLRIKRDMLACSILAAVAVGLKASGFRLQRHDI